MEDVAGTEKDELIERLRELEQRQLRMFARDRSLPLLTTSLTIQQLKVLLRLSLDGEMAAHELAEGAGVGMATLTGIVDRLVARGLVCRREDPRDRRVRRIDLTEEGRGLMAEMSGAGHQRHYAALARLDTATLADLVRGFEALCEALEAESAEEEGGGSR